MSTDPRTIESEQAERIWKLLRSCRGQEMAKTAPALAKETGIPERHVRRLIASHFREWAQTHQVVLCSLPGKGFYLAESVEQITATRRSLERLRVTLAHKLDRFDWMVREAGFRKAVELEVGA